MSRPSETSALLPSSGALRAELKRASGGDGKIQKSEFKVLFLSLGIRVKQAVLEDIFTAADKDGDGALTVDEIFDHVDRIKPKTLGDAIAYTAYKTTSSVVWRFSVAFHFAAWVGITSFCYTEMGKRIRPEWSIVGKCDECDCISNMTRHHLTIILVWASNLTHRRLVFLFRRRLLL